MGRTIRAVTAAGAIGAAALLAACSSDTAAPTTTAAATTTVVTTTTTGPPTSQASTTSAATTSEPADTEPIESEPAGTAAPTTDAPTTTAAAATTTTAASAIGPYTSEIYSDPAHWICRGDTLDICDDAYPLSTIAADGTSTAVPYTVAQDAPIDCFYVYPTSSADATFNSDLSPDSEIGVTTYQAARFNQVCRMYVPVYRSVTLAGLFGHAQPGGGTSSMADGWPLAYGDVLDAWKHYLANDNHGRPVVILSHSQGSFHVTRLLREEIDPNPAERDLIVSAILPGTSFQVAKGDDVGGDTQNMPLCSRDDQFGCVITYQSYRDSVPPLKGALFGAPGATTDSACTNPAALAGGSGTLDNSLANGDWVLNDPALRAAVTTPLVDLPGLVTSECKVTEDGYHYLAISTNGDPTDPRADDVPGDGQANWGLHSIDLNVAQETLIQLVRDQSAAYLTSHASG
jgi:hypothetical protein